MYSTKLVNPRMQNSLTGEKLAFLAASKDPYVGNKDSAIDGGSRYRGKQFMTRPPIRPAGADTGFFSKIKYDAGKFDDSTGYLKTQPLENRRNGFGTHMPKCRDQFTSHIETERYRELLKRENAMAADTLKAQTARLAESGGLGRSRTMGRTNRSELLSSGSVGWGAWEVDRPRYGRVATTKSFNDVSHMDG